MKGVKLEIKGIAGQQHRQLLAKISRLPVAQETVYRKSADELFEKQEALAAELKAAIQAYQEITSLVDSREPLVNKREYARVRRIVRYDRKETAFK